MVKILNTKEKNFKIKFKNLLKKRDNDDFKIDKVVSNIISEVRSDSDKAIVR